MLKENGAKELREYAAEEFPRQVLKVDERIYHVLGYGHSNAIIIIGDTSVILVDTLESALSGETLKAVVSELTAKPVQTIIYTHGHPDHRFGAVAFADTVQEIIAFAPQNKPLKHTEKIAGALNKRAFKQFGYQLTDEELITQGLGIREKHDGRAEKMLAPTTLYREAEVTRTIDGVTFTMIAAPGETDDQIFIWLPAEKMLCCGDNYYPCWPNLYAIRGGQYRDVAAWADSLRHMLCYPAKALLPGHGRPVIGEEKIKEILGNYAGALESVLLQTLDCIDQGLGLAETVEKVKLPEEYRNLSYLREFYGSIDWSVRSIYQGYVGWFDGNPTALHPLSEKAYAERLLPLLGGEERVRELIDEAMEKADWQWGLQLCDLVLQYNEANDAVKQQKAQILFKIADLETSANGRHFYIATAKELLAE